MAADRTESDDGQIANLAAVTVAAVSAVDDLPICPVEPEGVGHEVVEERLRRRADALVRGGELGADARGFYPSPFPAGVRTS